MVVELRQQDHEPIAPCQYLCSAAMQTPCQRRVSQFLAAHGCQLDDVLVDYIAESLQVGTDPEDLDDFLASAAAPAWGEQRIMDRQRSLRALLAGFKTGGLAPEAFPDMRSGPTSGAATTGMNLGAGQGPPLQGRPVIVEEHSGGSARQSCAKEKFPEASFVKGANSRGEGSEAATPDPCRHTVMAAQLCASMGRRP